MMERSQIIYLNGPSSSGKSTLVKALQDAFEEPFLHLGLDKIIGFMPEKINNWTGGEAPLGFSCVKGLDPTGHPVYRIRSGSFAKRIVRSLKDIAFLLASQNYHLIIDDVAFGAIEVEEWKKVLEGHHTLFVGVVAPLPILEEREKARGDRILGSARGQYYQVHENAAYDLEINTHTTSLEDNVKAIQEALNKKSAKK